MKKPLRLIVLSTVAGLLAGGLVLLAINKNGKLHTCPTQQKCEVTKKCVPIKGQQQCLKKTNSFKTCSTAEKSSAVTASKACRKKDGVKKCNKASTQPKETCKKELKKTPIATDINILKDLTDPLATWKHNGQNHSYTVSQMITDMGEKYKLMQMRMQKEKPEFVKKRMFRLADGHLKDHLFLQIAKKDGVERIGKEPVPNVINRWAEHILMKRLTVDPIKLQIFIKDIKKKYKNADKLSSQQFEVAYRKNEMRSQLKKMMDKFVKETNLVKHYKLKE